MTARLAGLLDGVRQYAARHDLWQPSTRVVAAVSGGSDSVAMLWLLHDLHARGELHLAVVAHLHHGIRPDADEDEAFCAALAERLGVNFSAARVDVPARARAGRQSLELAGRAARRAFLDDVRRTHAADVIATAHTRDDQAETVLLRLLRGAGSRGLGGIAPRASRRVRPVLWATRDDLRAGLRARGETWRDDPTNADVRIARNRVRHEVLPYLERHFNPSARAALARLADLARSDDDWLRRLAAAAAVDTIAVEIDRPVRLRRDTLAMLPEAIGRRVVHQALAAAGARMAGLRDVEAVLDAARGGPAADVAGVRVEPSGEFVVLLHKGRVLPPTAAFRHELPVPGCVSIPQTGWMLEAVGPLPRTGEFDTSMAQAEVSSAVQVAADELGDGLVVRSRRPGDRLQPLGMSGRKKVQDLLVDRKVPRAQRPGVPVVTDRSGRIVWVAGHAMSEAFRVTERTKAVIILKLRRI